MARKNVVEFGDVEEAVDLRCYFKLDVMRGIRDVANHAFLLTGHARRAKDRVGTVEDLHSSSPLRLLDFEFEQRGRSKIHFGTNSAREGADYLGTGTQKTSG